MYNRLSGRHGATSRTKHSSSVAVESIDPLGMLIHQGNGLIRVQVDGESIVVVRAPGEVGVSKLPEQIRDLLLERNSLPPAHGLETRVVGDGAEILQAGLGREPAVLLVDDGLAGGAGGLGVVPDPLVGPRDGLCPPLESIVSTEASLCRGQRVYLRRGTCGTRQSRWCRWQSRRRSHRRRRRCRPSRPTHG
jgi:hypothetical protein